MQKTHTRTQIALDSDNERHRKQKHKQYKFTVYKYVGWTMLWPTILMFLTFALRTNLNETAETNEINSYERQTVWISLERDRIACASVQRECM